MGIIKLLMLKKKVTCLRLTTSSNDETVCERCTQVWSRINHSFLILEMKH